MGNIARFAKGGYYKWISREFDSGVSSVTISVKQYDDDGAVALDSNVCAKMTGENAWKWSTQNFTTQPVARKEYYYKMTADTGEFYSGMFCIGGDPDKLYDIDGKTTNLPAVPASQGDVTSGTSTVTGAITTSEGNIRGGTETIGTVKTAVDGVVAGVWSAGARTLTSFGTLVADIWSYATRTITAGGITAAEIWDYLLTSIATPGSIGKLLKDSITISLSALESNIRGADNDTLKTLSDQIDGVQGGAETLESLKAAIDTKASQSSLDTLTTVVGTKASQASITALGSPAQATVTATGAEVEAAKQAVLDDAQAKFDSLGVTKQVLTAEEHEKIMSPMPIRINAANTIKYSGVVGSNCRLIESVFDFYDQLIDQPLEWPKVWIFKEDVLLVDGDAMSETEPGSYFYNYPVPPPVGETLYVKYEGVVDGEFKYNTAIIETVNNTVVDLAEVKELIRETQPYNISYEFVTATVENPTRKVAVGRLDYVVIKVKEDSAVDWTDPVREERLFAWYNTLGDKNPRWSRESD